MPFGSLIERESGKFFLWNGKTWLWNPAYRPSNPDPKNNCNPESMFHWQKIPEKSSAWNPESTTWNPESKTAVDSLTWGEFSFPMSESWYKCRDTAPLSTACVLIQQLLHEPFFYGERGRIIFLHCLTLFVTTSYIQIYTKKLLLTKCFLSRSVSRIFLRTGCTTKECLNWLVKWTNHKSEYEEGFWLVNNIKWTAESTYHTYLLTLQNESRRSSRRGGEGAQPQHP